MQNSFPTIRKAKDGAQAVNARDLHAFLNVGRDFSTWIKSRITYYGFEQELDFTVERIFPKSGEKSNRGRSSVEYFISLDMAKELAMVENNDKGRKVRRYFIECEKTAKTVHVREHNRRPPTPAVQEGHFNLKQSAPGKLIRVDALVPFDLAAEYAMMFSNYRRVTF